MKRKKCDVKRGRRGPCWAGLGLLLLLVFGHVPQPARAFQDTHHAALVVDFGDGRVIARVVAFDEETISGADLLLRSGLNVALTGGLGAGMALCAIEEVGCPPTPQDCFCQCQGTDCHYWNYYHLEGGQWVYALLGASDHELGDGDVDGWVWGDGSSPPPLLSWEEILSLAQQPAEPTATAPPPPPSETHTLPPNPTEPPTASPLPTAPATVKLSASPQSTMTTLPTATATATATAAASLPPTAPPPEVSPAASPPLPQSTPAETGESGPSLAGALSFGAMVLLLGAMWLWARRRN